MKTITFKVSKEKRIIEGKEQLEKIGILDQVAHVIAANGILIEHQYLSEDGICYLINEVAKDLKYTYYELEELTLVSTKKNKYVKVEMKKKHIEKLAKDIGFVNAQQLHATDYNTYSYMPLRQYLKENKEQFKNKFIYEKDYNDQFRILRHKNLFSKYKDEVSDFEKFTTIERYEPKSLKVSYEIDDDVFEYNDSSATIQERKFMRELAKDIYTKKSRYTERELFEILSGRDLYIRIVETTPKEHKDVWSKVSLDDMDIRVLQKHRGEFKKSNVPTDKKRKYMSKHQKRRRARRQIERDNLGRLKEYYEYND